MQVMAWRRKGDTTWPNVDLVYWRIYTALEEDELTGTKQPIRHGAGPRTGEMEHM